MTDSSSDVREKALTCIGKYFAYSEFAPVIEGALKDSSYKVISRAFKIISEKDDAKAKNIARVLEKDSSDVILSRLSEYYITSSENKIALYKKALQFNNSFNRYTVIKNFTSYLNNSIDTEIISEGADILADRSNKTTSKRSRAAYLNSLKEIESSLNKKISQNEDELINIQESTIKIEKEATLSGLKSLRNKLHDNISTLDK